MDACARCRAIVAAAGRRTQPQGVVQPSFSTISERRARRRAQSQSEEATGLEPGSRIGRYIVERAIGAGGMGVVSLARDPELRRPVVIKLVRADVGGDESRDELEARLQREAQAMARLSHPNVVQIFDIGDHGDRVFLAMEYIAGQTLDAWLLESPRSPEEILAMVRQAGAGLDAAHRAGLVHRDFKPANVLVNAEGVAKVTDFGLARIPKVGAPNITRRLAAPRLSGVHAELTHADTIVGTPAYMAPEQAEGGIVDARSDQYAFALVLLDALVHQSPIDRTVDPSSSTDLEAEIDRALDDVVAPRVRAAIARALREDPVQRFVSLGELMRELAPSKRPRRWPIVAGLALCGIAVVLWFATKRDAEGSTCVASAPHTWSAGARKQLIATYAASPRPFEAWTGAKLAAEIDRAVDRLAADEVASCQRRRSTAEHACLEHRLAALADAVQPKIDDDPSLLVHAIEACSPSAPEPATSKLRDELRGAVSRPRAEQLAEKATALRDHRLAAEAYEAAALQALAANEVVEAERLLFAELEAGERANDDAARGRARLYLLDVAAWNGDFAAANRDGNALRSINARQVPEPHVELAIAMHEAAAFGDVGDAKRAMAAWEHALAQAKAIGSVDDQLRARAGRAWARHADHFDLAAARSEITTALAEASAASPQTRAHALVVQGKLAFAAGDGAAARAAYAEAARLDPQRATAVADRIRAARARALTDVAGALAELETIADDETKRRVTLARAQVLRAAGRAAEAREILLELVYEIRPRGDVRGPVSLSSHERFDIALERCDADIDLGRTTGCDLGLVKSLHPTAPVRARIHVSRLRESRMQGRKYLIGVELEKLIAIFEANEAPMVRIAELQWELARSEHLAKPEDRRTLAGKARDGFASAKRDAEVEAIDRWLSEGASDAGVSFTRDRHGPIP